MSTNARPILSRPMPSPDAIAALGDIDPLHARLFAMRGLTEAAQLDYGLARLAPVSRLDNIDEAAELVIANRDRRIVVVGDFDVDGATSTALILRCLREFGFSEVDYLVPNRFEYGYGLTPEIVALAAQRQPDLIITVDNGISSLEGVDAAEGGRLNIFFRPEHATVVEAGQGHFQAKVLSAFFLGDRTRLLVNGDTPEPLKVEAPGRQAFRKGETVDILLDLEALFTLSEA